MGTPPCRNNLWCTCFTRDTRRSTHPLTCSGVGPSSRLSRPEESSCRPAQNPAVAIHDAQREQRDSFNFQPGKSQRFPREQNGRSTATGGNETSSTSPSKRPKRINSWQILVESVVNRIQTVGTMHALAKDGAAHGADGEVSGEGDEVGPGNGVAVLELDRLK